MSWTRLQPPTPVLDPPLNFDIYILCVFSEIPGTSPLPWATRRKWLNAGYIVGRISGTRISVDLVQKSYLAITLSSDCVGQQIAELQFRPSTGTISYRICMCHATISEKHDAVLLEHLTVSFRCWIILWMPRHVMVRAPYSYRYSVLQRLFLGAVPWISNELVADWLLNLCPAQTTGVVMTYELAW